MLPPPVGVEIEAYRAFGPRWVGVNEPGTDFGALRAGYVSVTPLQLDLTAREAMDGLKKWKW
jgi:5'-nucleotidase